MQINGILLVNKERGMSSNTVVNKVKKILQAEKAGHLGTLDVLGEGLLPVTLGKGTKLFDYFLKKDKTYLTVFKFGQTTSTLDLEGDIIAQNDVVVTKEMIDEVLHKFIGKIKQVPPKYSAKKVEGKRAYQLAREGKRLNLPANEITIYSIECINKMDFNTYTFLVHCSSGTYIRSLCRDLAAQFGTFGVMQYIQRTKCGDFSIRNSYSLDQIQKGNYKIIELDKILNRKKKIQLDDESTQKLLNGCIINTDLNNGTYRAYNQNQFLGLVIVRENKLKFKLRLI